MREGIGGEGRRRKQGQRRLRDPARHRASTEHRHRAPGASGRIGRESEALPAEIAGGVGSVLFGVRGERWIDFSSGWCVGNLGWANPLVRNALDSYEGPDYVPPNAIYAPWTELAERLLTIAPGKLDSCWRTTGGTEAVEFALRAAMQHTGRRAFVCIEDAYHGNSMAATALVGGGAGRFFRTVRIPAPLEAKAAAKIEHALARREIAAVIMEPIVLNLGVVSPSHEFMTRVARACRRTGTLLVMDEVATGFGRTGTLFATERFDIAPDIVCLAKAMSSGCNPIGATLTTKAVARSMRDAGGGFYSTYGWHPRSVAVALATLRFWSENGQALLRHVELTSHLFEERLREMAWPAGTEIRVRGLAIGIELPEERLAEDIAARALERGLLLSGEDGVLSIFPALNIPRELATEGLQILDACLP